MAKYVKAIDGTLYNLDHISSIWWQSNVSGTAVYKHELFIGGPHNKDIVCKCNTENEKAQIDAELEKFIQNDEKLYRFSKF